MFRVNNELIRSLALPFGSRWLFDVELLLRLRCLHGDLARIAYEAPLHCWAEQPGSKVKANSYLNALRELCRLTWKYRTPAPLETTSSVPATPTAELLAGAMAGRTSRRRAA